MSGALEGLKVLDMTWVVVGPTAMRVFADHGATVVKVETGTRVDTARTAGPFWQGQPGPESSACFNNGNAGKLGMMLNLRVPAAREVLTRLVRWADVMAENFTPHVMRRWGLDYDSVRAINPRIIYLSASMCGQDGPYANLAAIGNVGAAIGGFSNIVGWPDRPPSGPGGAYTDYVAAKYITISLLAALEYRDRTGLGQFIDLAQSETAVHFLAPAFLEWQVNGRLPERIANRSHEYAPQGVFACAGHEQWLALTVRDDREWESLARVIGRDDLADDPELRGVTARMRRLDEVEAAIAAWTSGLEVAEAEARLVTAGVPAHAAADSAMAVADAQLNHRGHFVRVPNDALGEITLENTRFTLSRTPSAVVVGGPLFGQHNGRVLEEFLGFTDEEVAELAAQGAFD